MTDDMRKSLKTDIWSVPNILSYLRLIMIPIFVWLFRLGMYLEAFLTLCASGLTDICDGRIARKYNMVTDFGKFIDPLADKLTQIGVFLCLAFDRPIMFTLVGIMVLKELVMLIMGIVVLHKTSTVNGALWYGKVTTAILYAVMLLYVIIPNIPSNVSMLLTLVCIGMVIFSFVMYLLRYAVILKKKGA